MSIGERIQRLRDRYPVLDHVFRMNDHVTRVEGNLLAGGITYFGFLSFFPLLALSFAVAGWASTVYPDADETVVTAIESVLPGIISSTPGEGQISLEQISDAAGAIGAIAVLTLLYSGLGWVSALRETVTTVLEVSFTRRPGFVVGKLWDLLTLVVIGLVLTLSVSVTSIAGGATDWILELVRTPGPVAATLVYVLGALLGLVASTALFFAIFRLMSRGTHVPSWALRRGALLAAIGFEVLKFLVVFVLGTLGGTPFAPLALAVTLVVWINYCSRLTVYGAAWAYTTSGVAALPTVPSADPTRIGPLEATSTIRIESPQPVAASLVAAVRPVAVFGAVLAALYAWLRHEKERERSLR